MFISCDLDKLIIELPYLFSSIVRLVKLTNKVKYTTKCDYKNTCNILNHYSGALPNKMHKFSII